MLLHAGQMQCLRVIQHISRFGAITVSLRRMKPSIENSSLRDQVVLITGGARRGGAGVARRPPGGGGGILILYSRPAAPAVALGAPVNQVRRPSAARRSATLLAPA